MKPHRLSQAVLLGWLAITALPAVAHPAIEHQLEKVNTQLAQQPDDAELLLERGKLLLDHSETEKALADFSKASEREPTLGDAWYWRAQAELSLKHYAAAQQSNASFLALHPAGASHAPARARGLLQCGDIHMAAGQTRQAAECYRAGITLAPASPEQHLQLISALRQGKDADGALRAVEAAIQAHGELPQLLDQAVAIESERQRYREALQWNERALQQPLRREYTLLQKATLQEALHDKAGAQQSLTAALAAIAALPPTKRHSEATLRLEQQIQQQLQAINQSNSPSGTATSATH